MAIEAKAAIARAVGQPLVIEPVQLAEPGFDEVLVQIKASGICHTDLNFMNGGNPHAFPAIFGHEGAGVVVDRGAAVTGLEIGDHVVPFLAPHCGQCAYCRSGRTNVCQQFFVRMQQGFSRFSQGGAPVAAVFGLGTFAEYTVVKADMIAKIRKDLAFDKACYIACGGATGLGAALYSAKVQPGSSVVVFGLGGVGLNVIQGARLAKASIIVGVDTNAARETVARKLGATHFINPKLSENMVAEIAAATGGADFSFECVGSPALMRTALECTNPAWGKATVVGVAAHGHTIEVVPGSLMMGRHLTGTFMGGVRPAQLSEMADWLLNGDIDFDDLITHRLKLDAVNQGIAAMKSGAAIRSVIVFD